MGLVAYAEVVLPTETPLMGFPIDYSDAMQDFANIFYNQATNTVPVDTGTLQSSISADPDEDTCECHADTDYAEYVEYGTYKMDAQPYFQPAVQEALDSATVAAQDIYDEAIEEDRIAYQEMKKQGMAALSSDKGEVGGIGLSFGGGGPGLMGFIGGILGAVLGELIWAVTPLGMLQYLTDTPNWGARAERDAIANNLDMTPWPFNLLIGAGSQGSSSRHDISNDAIVVTIDID